MKGFARTAYGLVVQSHPLEFRSEFGEEMLWIFDEQMRCGRNYVDRAECFLKLLLDGLGSALVQHAFREQQHARAGETLFLCIEAPSRLNHIAQGAFIAFCCVFPIFSAFFFIDLVFFHL
jgi:hypothetical protein